MKNVSDGFEMLMKETGTIGPHFMESVMNLSKESALEKKVHELAYISVLVATKMYGGLPFHITQAKKLGATKEEIKSAMLVPLPIMGIQVGDALPYLEAFSEE